MQSCRIPAMIKLIANSGMQIKKNEHTLTLRPAALNPVTFNSFSTTSCPENDIQVWPSPCVVNGYKIRWRCATITHHMVERSFTDTIGSPHFSLRRSLYSVSGNHNFELV